MEDTKMEIPEVLAEALETAQLVGLQEVVVQEIQVDTHHQREIQAAVVHHHHNSNQPEAAVAQELQEETVVLQVQVLQIQFQDQINFILKVVQEKVVIHIHQMLHHHNQVEFMVLVVIALEFLAHLLIINLIQV